MAVNPEDLGARLRAAREHASMTQAEAAHVLQKTPSAIAQYEAGSRRVDALDLERLAHAYGASIDALLGLSDEPTESWEAALRRLAAVFPEQARIGIGRVLDRVRAFDDLAAALNVSLPPAPHPPFPALPDKRIPDAYVRERAEAARRHFRLGTTPIADVKAFLEDHGYQVFAVDLGEGQEGVSGLHLLHPRLGHVAVINDAQAVSRWPFSLAHELAHGLFHYDRSAVLCRTSDSRPMEAFADAFAGHFLVPRDALSERLTHMGVDRVDDAETIVELARHFGVSFHAMVVRLRKARKLSVGDEALADVRPLFLARRLGFNPSPYEFGERPLPFEARLPRALVRLGYRAIEERVLSLRRVAELFGISDIELRERLEDHASWDAKETQLA